MSRYGLLLACTLFASLGCAGTAGRPRDVHAAPATVTVAPPYHDPEYALRLAMPDPADWDERYHIDGGENAPDPMLRLTRRSDGAVIEVLFVPRAGGTPAEFAAHLRTDVGNAVTPVTASPDGSAATFESASGGRRTRHRVFHLAGMTRSHAYMRVTASTASFAAAATLFDALATSASVVPTGPLSPRAALAQCLAAKGVRLYGTWWCGPCHMQEQLFGDGASRLDHTQCSAPGETDQLPVCAAAGIRSYPTWVFPDGTRLEGVQSLEDLAAKSHCPAPPREPAAP
jgi:hypothetical protein